MAVTLLQLLQTMVKNDGSDLHVAANSSPMIRVRGDMVKLGVPPITPIELIAMVEQITDAGKIPGLDDQGEGGRSAGRCPAYHPATGAVGLAQAARPSGALLRETLFA